MTAAAAPYRTVWRVGDELGRRLFAPIGPIDLDVGGRLDDVTICYETWGQLDETKSNAVLVLHGFTADSHAAGPAAPGHPEPGWWDGVIGPGLGIDTDKYFIVCPNALGGCQGTTGPASPGADTFALGSRWPVTTIRDLVSAERKLSDHLGIAQWHGVIGVSLGGMRALEWCIESPTRVARAVIIGVGAQASAEQIALQCMQMRAIEDDPAFHGGDYYGVGDGRGPIVGMGLARRIGHLSYRSELEMHERFGNRAQPGEDPLAADRKGRFAVESYLDHAAARLERRFDPNTYLALNEAMNHHDIGRGRGGVAEAMRRATAALTIVGLDGDRLYPLRLQEELVAVAPNGAEFEIVHSAVGHDAFLIEDAQMSALIGRALRA